MAIALRNGPSMDDIRVANMNLLINTRTRVGLASRSSRRAPALFHEHQMDY